MITINARIRGLSPILQHKFGSATLESLMQGANRKSGAVDYSKEWLETMYATADGLVFQPASHLEACMVKAASLFKIKGRAGKTYKDMFRGYVYVSPEEVPIIWRDTYITAPDESLLLEPTEALSVSVMRVVVQRSAVARSRLQVSAGWELDFNIEIHEEQLRPEVIEQVLREAGRSIGIGDFRPRYGRFEVLKFEVVKQG